MLLSMRDHLAQPDYADDVLALALRPTLPSPADAAGLLRARGILGTELAAALGVTPQTVSNWLCGRSTPTGRNRDRYASALRLIQAGGLELVRGESE